jgi:hypothetical protein
VSGLLDAYRRTGADLPFGDPRRAHGVAMEGYYWRLSDPASRRCVIALCGVCRVPRGGAAAERTRSRAARSGGAGEEPWAVVALAGHPGGFVRWRATETAAAEPEALGAAAWDAGAPVLRGSERRIAVDLGPDARLEAVLEGRVGWPRARLGALGLAQAAPGLPQYWHPAVLGARVRGEAVLGGETVSLDGWDGYVEKNWGGTFPGEWWWGQAALGEGAMAAFAGGRLGGPLAASAIVVRAGGSLVPFAPPAALVTASAGGGEWRLRGRTPRWSVTLEGSAAFPPHMLPVPVPAERRAVMRSEHHLAGRLRVVLRRGRRVVLRGESDLAGLEHGVPGE